MNKRREISIRLRQGLNSDRLVACHLNGNLKIIYRRVRGWGKVFILNHSACQAVKMEMCPAGDSSLEDAAAGERRFFDLFAFLKRCATLPAQFSRHSTSVSHGRQRGTDGGLAPRTILLTVCRYSGQKYSTLSLIMQD